jgi:hypothetical protein
MPVVEYRGMQLIVPENDSEFLGYFEAAKQHRLVMKKCSACNLMRYPPGSGCPWCMSQEWTWQEVSGKGTIYSYEIIVHAIQPGFRAVAPYPVVVVELDEQRGVPTEHEGLRMVANLVDAQCNPEAEQNVAIGKRVRVVFQEVSAEFTLPQFMLSNEPSAGPVWQFPS